MSGRQMGFEDSKRLLGSYGIPILGKVASSLPEATAAALAAWRQTFLAAG